MQILDATVNVCREQNNTQCKAEKFALKTILSNVSK